MGLDMKKTIFFLFLLGLFLCLSTAAMADTDMVLLPTTSHRYTGSGASLEPNILDGNFDTGYGQSIGGGEGGKDSVVQVDFTFSYPVHITRIDFRLGAGGGGYGNDHGQGWYEWYIMYSVDGTNWLEVLPGYVAYTTNTKTHSYGSCYRYQGGASCGSDSQTVAPTGNSITGLDLSNVKYIRAYAHGYGYGYGGGSASAHGDAFIYELHAWGNVDIGLRAYDGAGIVKIACEPTGILTSPLRISKNGTTYAITLVDPTDPNASKIRIKTSSGIKALRKY